MKMIIKIVCTNIVFKEIQIWGKTGKIPDFFSEYIF